MSSVLNETSLRDRQILAGFFLSKYDEEGLLALGFGTFTEAFNVIGYALGGRPASIKNYRDEFDPLHPNSRSGWKNRPIRDYCLKVAQPHRDLDIIAFTYLLRSFMDIAVADADTDQANEPDEQALAYMKRSMTGRAAEQYFRDAHRSLPEFADHELEDTTQQGCGYDFRMHPKTGGDFRAVEVKGLATRSGSITLTHKEWKAAEALADRFDLFVVKNFCERPFHCLYAGPLSSALNFTRNERPIVQVSWQAAV